MRHFLPLALLLLACSSDDGATEAPPVTAGTGGSAGAQAGSGGVAGQAGVSGLGGAAGSAQEAGSGGLAGSGGEAAGQGGDAGTGGSDAGSGGAPSAGAAGEAGAGGEAGGAGAPVCVEGPSPLKLCSACDGSWVIQGGETPVMLDGGKQVVLHYCKDKTCAVYIKKFSDGTLGSKQTGANCDAALGIMRAAMYGSVDAAYLGLGQTLRLTLRVGYQPECAGILNQTDFSMPVTVSAANWFDNTIGCGPDLSPAVWCPSFPEESVKVCTECLTDSCNLIPVDAVRDTLLAYLGNELRRQVAALASGSCDAAPGANPPGEACVSPIK